MGFGDNFFPAVTCLECLYTVYKRITFFQITGVKLMLA